MVGVVRTASHHISVLITWCGDIERVPLLRHHQSRVVLCCNHRVVRCFQVQALLRPRDQEGDRVGRGARRIRASYDTCGV
jgi:hypothetical protein